MNLPAHKGHLLLEHGAYRTRQVAVMNPLFQSPAHKERAIAANSVWVLSWSPEGVGKYCVGAPTLDEVLEWAAAIEATFADIKKRMC